MAKRTIDRLEIKLEQDGSGKVSASLADVERRLVDTDKATDRASKRMASFQAAAKAASGIAAIAGGAAAAWAVNATRDWARTAKEVQAYSDALGLSTEVISGWQYAAKDVNVQADKMADIFKDVSDKIGDAFLNNGGEAKEALDTLGLSAEKLANQSPDQQLLAIAGALDQVQSRSAKVQILESIGDDAALLLPLLENDAARLRDLTDEAEAFGAVIDEEAAAKAKEFNDSMRRLEGSATGLKNQLAENLAPSLTRIADAAALAAKEGGVLQGVLVGIGGLFSEALGLNDAEPQIRKTGESLAEVSLRVQTLEGYVASSRAEIEEMRRATKTLAEEHGEGSAAVENYRAAIEQKRQALGQMEQNLATAREKLAGLNEEQKKTNEGRPLKQTADDAREAARAVAGLGDEWDAVLDIYVAEEEANQRRWAQQQAGIEQTKQGMDEVAEKGQGMGDALTTAVTGWASNMSSQLNELVWEADRSFGDILRAFAKMITQMLIQKSIVEPLLGGLDFGTTQAQGGVWQGGVQAFASGGVVASPTLFPMAGGKRGLMGEEGPEAIMPLKRMSNGDLGVQMNGGGGAAVAVNLNVVNQTGTPVEAEQRTNPNGDITLLLSRAASDDIGRGGPLARTMEKTYGLRRQGVRRG